MNENFFQKIRETSILYSKAKALRVKQVNIKKILKSELMVEAKNKGIKTVSSQENYAQIQPEYKNLVNELSDAIEKETLYYWDLRCFEMEMEYWRTSQATKRAEMKLI
jgi:Holliday junction resolvase RusA-like endonuclease